MEELIAADTFASKLSDRMLSCRELGHVWRPFTVEVIKEGRRIGGFLRIMKCHQCRTERRQLLDSRGGIISNGYHYVDGYLASHVQPGFTRDTFRLEAVTRWFEKHPATPTNIESKRKAS